MIGGVTKSLAGGERGPGSGGARLGGRGLVRVCGRRFLPREGSWRNDVGANAARGSDISDPLAVWNWREGRFLLFLSGSAEHGFGSQLLIELQFLMAERSFSIVLVNHWKRMNPEEFRRVLEA